MSGYRLSTRWIQPDAGFPRTAKKLTPSKGQGYRAVRRIVVQRSPAVLNREIFVKLFTENLQVDFRSEMVREICQICVDYLVDIGWLT